METWTTPVDTSDIDRRLTNARMRRRPANLVLTANMANQLAAVQLDSLPPVTPTVTAVLRQQAVQRMKLEILYGSVFTLTASAIRNRARVRRLQRDVYGDDRPSVLLPKGTTLAVARKARADQLAQAQKTAARPVRKTAAARPVKQTAATPGVRLDYAGLRRLAEARFTPDLTKPVPPAAPIVASALGRQLRAERRRKVELAYAKAR
jgi:hypothetical protein